MDLLEAILLTTCGGYGAPFVVLMSGKTRLRKTGLFMESISLLITNDMKTLLTSLSLSLTLICVLVCYEDYIH